MTVTPDSVCAQSLVSFVDLVVSETGTDRDSLEALKAAVLVKRHRRQQSKVKRKIQNGPSDMHDASIFEFITSIY